MKTLEEATQAFSLKHHSKAEIDVKFKEYRSIIEEANANVWIIKQAFSGMHEIERGAHPAKVLLSMIILGITIGIEMEKPEMEKPE